MANLLVAVYMVVVGILSLYGLLGFVTFFLFWRHKGEKDRVPSVDEAALPDVTIQLPSVPDLYPRVAGTIPTSDEVHTLARFKPPAKSPAWIDFSFLTGMKRQKRKVTVKAIQGTEAVARLWARKYLDHKQAGRAKVRGLAAESQKLAVLSPATVFSLLTGKKTRKKRSVLMPTFATGGAGPAWAQLSSLTMPLRPFGGGAMQDSDRDKIPDVDDECPNEPETYNGFEDDDGCPDKGRVVVGAKEIKILDKIYFESKKATIRKESFGLVDAIASTIKGHPSIRLVEIAGHTDERRTPGISNKKLSQLRAEAVRTALVEREVEPQRLVARGYGSEQPLDKASNEKAWAKNRRVEFVIRQRQGAVEKIKRRAKKFALQAQPSPAPKRPTDREIGRARQKVASVTGSRAARLALLRLLAAAGKAAEAIKAAIQWRKVDPLNLAVHRILADLYRSSGRTAEAVVAYRNILELAPRQPEAFRLLAAILDQARKTGTAAPKKAGKLLTALSYLDTAYRMRPKDPCYTLELAATHLAHGRAGRALSGVNRP